MTLSGHGDARSKADKDNPFIEIPEPNLPAAISAHAVLSTPLVATGRSEAMARNAIHQDNTGNNPYAQRRREAVDGKQEASRTLWTAFIPTRFRRLTYETGGACSPEPVS
jgi:hypothetical protein